MPKRLAEYTLSDWRNLRPLTQNYKRLRYRLVNSIHMRRRARKGDVGALAGCIHGKKVLVTIAFSDPQLIEWQAQLMRTYVSQSVYLIADNSPDDALRPSIATIAERHGSPYVRLPANPWGRGSRSHGISMNWLWRNIILPGEPEAFGFLDHDLFPTAPDDPFSALSTQDFYGLVRTAGPRWFLWAGFCVFKFDNVRHKPLDFGQDWFVGLDTGGGNWEVLYRHVDRAMLPRASVMGGAFQAGAGHKGRAYAVVWHVDPRGAPCGTPRTGCREARSPRPLLAPHLAEAQARIAAGDPIRLSGRDM